MLHGHFVNFFALNYVDEEGCSDPTGKNPSKGFEKVPVFPVPVPTAMTTAVTQMTVPMITNEALHCQRLSQRKRRTR
ncbi:hypothetical protein CEXT_344201 [Caerostris extrusa]|uniref:Uncharacterized protein n=1 Tax=Caerostris extrusa TaxID=172846 RepID=A0AAV4XWT4_CAEEX|nr:hypothetical protein CEXT_344201 [Caerostris extrusa]